MNMAGLPELAGDMRWSRICEAAALAEGGDGVRFEWCGPAGRAPAFVVRHDGRARAYVNRCSHVPVELDWQPGKFFDASGLYLICATHGAMYEPASGRCAGGPCGRRPLQAIPVHEHDGSIWVAINDGDR